MSQVIRELVLKFFAPNGCATRPITKRVSSLNHEFRDDAMENHTLEITASCMPHEILHSLGSLRWEQPNVYVSERGMNRGCIGQGGWTAFTDWCSCSNSLLLSGWAFIEDITISRFIVPVPALAHAPLQANNLAYPGATRVNM